MIVAIAIALFSAAALVAFAARQSGPDRANKGTAAASRAQVNAAEERAVWATPRTAATVPDGSVAINGCLEKDGDQFRLTGAEGTTAPKSRSWKSMFLKKSSASLDIVDVKPGVIPRIASHVGERVRVTGVLEDRDIHLRTLLPLNESCS